MKLVHLLVLLTFALTSRVNGSRILGIFPHGARSHFYAVDILMEALANRGHDVVVLSPFPRKTPLKHYTDISLADVVTDLTSDIPLDVYSVGEDRVELSLMGLFMLANDSCIQTLSSPKVKKLTEEKFDLVIYEAFNTDCFLGLVSKFDAPYIAISSSAMMPWHNERFGNPDNPSYIPFHFLPHSDSMTYLQRLKNAVYLQGTKLLYHYFNYLSSVEIAKKYLGDDLPCLKQVAKNTSLLLLNNHFTMNLPRPHVPAIIEVGGIHIKPTPKLPQDIEKFINDAKDGVIYFSFGSTVKASSFPEYKRRALLEAFSKLPQRVLWKWEGDLPGKPNNVMTNKWMPQPGILNHPNVRVFICHGGLMGTMEAVAAGVPMVAIPLFGDQPMNVAALVKNGVAVRLDYPAITTTNVLNALRTILENPSYAENAKRLASAFNDRPLSALDTAIYWTEYTIKHKGAPFLRVASVDLNWCQYYMIDILTPIVLVALLILFLFYYMVKKFLLFIYSIVNKCLSFVSGLFGKSKSQPGKRTTSKVNPKHKKSN